MTLTASGGSDGSGAVYQWGIGTMVGSNAASTTTANTYEVSTDAATTYWVRRIGATACTDATSGTTTTIAAVASSTIILTSANNSQTVTINTAITAIQYTFANVYTLGFSGFPQGVTPSVSSLTSGTCNLSGTPIVTGIFTYTITATNNTGCSVTATGTITVIPAPITYTGCTTPTLTLTGVGFTSAATYSVNGLILSSPVTVTSCTKTDYSGGSSGAFNADCRSNSDTLYGHLFSWCMVVQYAAQLCPSPWRVPTTGDFCKIANGSESNCDNTVSQHIGINGWLTGNFCTYDGTLGGGVSGFYWSSLENEYNLDNGYIAFVTDHLNPKTHRIKSNGFALRCVRDAQ
jgi:uncharacterized protein (TIGR02145 family)